MIKRAASSTESISGFAFIRFLAAELGMSFNVLSPELHVANWALVNWSRNVVKMGVRCSHRTRWFLIIVDTNDIVGIQQWHVISIIIAFYWCRHIQYPASLFL